MSEQSKKKAPGNFHPYPYAYHHELDFEIIDLNGQASGVGKDGTWTIFVAGALVGEFVRARIFRNHKNYSEADLIEVLSVSKERREALCPIFTECGGCQLQNLRYQSQLEWKKNRLREIFLRLAGMEKAVKTCIKSPKEFAYRSKLTPHFARIRSGKVGDIGFLRKASRAVLVDVEQCAIADDSVNFALAKIRKRLHEHDFKGRRGATLLLRSGWDDDANRKIVADGGEIFQKQKSPICTEVVAGKKFQFPARAFFQVNPSILDDFVSLISNFAQRARDEFNCQLFFDAYCGCGFFSIILADLFEQVIGVEIDAESIKWARANAKTNGVTNVTFKEGDATTIFTNFEKSNLLQDSEKSEKILLVDPPRAGCSQEFISACLDLAPKAIIYVSCNPTTQARDALILAEKYKLDELAAVDFFPQTKHIESVALFVRLG